MCDAEVDVVGAPYWGFGSTSLVFAGAPCFKSLAKVPSFKPHPNTTNI